MEKEIKIEGMHCPACKALIEDVCSDFDEITSAVVDEKKGMLQIHAKDSFDLNALKSEIESLGEYTVRV